MEGEGMVAIVRALRDAELAVTVLDSGRQYTLLPSHLAQSAVNQVPTKQPRTDPQNAHRQQNSTIRPTINFNPTETKYRHDPRVQGNYVRDQVRTIDRSRPWRSNDVRQKATQYRTDGLMARGSQAVDGHYASTYQMAHCHVMPTSPPIECTEFPPQRSTTYPGQENFVVGGAGSGETYAVPTRATSFRGGWTEQAPTVSPRHSTQRTSMDSFAASLRKYPSLSPQRSHEILQRLISYTQAKFTGSGYRSPKRSMSPSRLSGGSHAERQVKSASCTSRSAYDTARANNSQRTYSIVRTDGPMKERSEDSRSEQSRKAARRSTCNSLHDPYNDISLGDYGRECHLRNTEVQAAPVKISKKMSTVPQPCPAQRTIAISNSCSSIPAVMCQEDDTRQANLNSSPSARESSFVSKESQTIDITMKNSNNPAFVSNDGPRTVSQRNHSTVYLLQQMQPCCSYSGSYAIVKKESVSNLHHEILELLKKIPIRPTSDPYEKTVRRKTLQELYKRLRKVSNIVETKSPQQDLLRTIREALENVLECEKCRRLMRKKRSEARPRICYSKFKQNRRRKMYDAKIKQTTLRTRKQSLEERFKHTVLMWFETLTLESNNYEYRLAIKNTILNAFIEQLQKCAEDRPDNEREYKSILKGETLDFLDEIPLVVNVPCNTRVHMHRLANKLIESLLELHAEEKLLERVSCSSKLMIGNSESTDCVFNDLSFTVIQPREDDIKREIRSELRHILRAENFTRDILDKIEQDLSDIILDSMDAIRFEREENVITEMIGVLRKTAHFRTNKAYVVAKMILKRVKRFRIRKRVLSCQYGIKKPHLINKCSSETYLVYQGTSELNTVLDINNDDLDDVDISLTEISNANIDENALRYKELISEQIDGWLTNLRSPLVNEQGLRQLVVDDLATDIVDRHKYVELNPSKKVSDVEELNYLRYQIFKWINKMAGEKNKETISQAPELMRMINGIPVPILTAPEQARALSVRAQSPARGIKRPTYVDKIVTVTSDWLKAIPAQFKPNKPFSLCHSRITDSDIIEMRAEELADSLSKGINKTKFPNDFIDSVINEWAKKLWKKRRPEHFDLLLELRKKLKHIQFVENTGSTRRSARGRLNMSIPVQVNRNEADRRKSLPGTACSTSCPSNSAEAQDNNNRSQEVPIQPTQSDSPSRVPSPTSPAHHSPPRNVPEPPSSPVSVEKSSIRRPENDQNEKHKKVNLILPNENNPPPTQAPLQPVAGPSRVTHEVVAGPSRETHEASAQQCGLSCPSSQRNTQQILNDLELYIHKWADELPIETKTKEEQEFAVMARQGIRNGIIMQIIKIRADPAAVADNFLCQDMLAQQVDELLDCLPPTPELLAKQTAMKAKLLEYVCNTNQKLQSQAQAEAQNSIAFGSTAYMDRYILSRYKGENEHIALVFRLKLIDAIKEAMNQQRGTGGDSPEFIEVEVMKAAMDRVKVPDENDVYLFLLLRNVEEEIKLWYLHLVPRTGKAPIPQDRLLALMQVLAQDAAKVITNSRNIKDLHKLIEDFLNKIIEDIYRPHIPNLIELLEQQLRDNPFVNSPIFIENIFPENYDDFAYGVMDSTRNPDCPLPCRPPPDALLQKRMEVQNAPPVEHSLPTWLYEGRDPPPMLASSLLSSRRMLENNQIPQISRPTSAGAPVQNPAWIQQNRGNDGSLHSHSLADGVSNRWDQSLPVHQGTPQLQSTPVHASFQNRMSPGISDIAYNESAYMSNVPINSPVNVSRQRAYELPQDSLFHEDFPSTVGAQQGLNISEVFPPCEGADVCRRATPQIIPTIQPQEQLPLAEPSPPRMRHTQEISAPVELSSPRPEQPIFEGAEISIPGSPRHSPARATTRHSSQIGPRPSTPRAAGHPASQRTSPHPSTPEPGSPAPCAQRSVPRSPVMQTQVSPRVNYRSPPSATQHSGIDYSVRSGTSQMAPPSPAIAVSADALARRRIDESTGSYQQGAQIPHILPAPCAQRSVPTSPVQQTGASPRVIHRSSPSAAQHSGMDSSVRSQMAPPPPAIAVAADVHQQSLRTANGSYQQGGQSPHVLTSPCAQRSVPSSPVMQTQAFPRDQQGGQSPHLLPAPCAERSVPSSPVMQTQVSPRVNYRSPPSATQHSGIDYSVRSGTSQMAPPLPPIVVAADVHQQSLSAATGSYQQGGQIPPSIAGDVPLAIPAKFQGATSHPTTSCDLLKNIANEIARMGRDPADSVISTTVMSKVTQCLQDPNTMEDDFRFKKSMEAMLDSVLDPFMFRDDTEKALYMSDVMHALRKVRDIKKTEEGVQEYRKKINNVIAKTLTPRTIATREQADLVQPLLNNLKENAGDTLVEMVFDPNTIDSCKRKLTYDIDQYVRDTGNNNIQLPFPGDQAVNSVLQSLQQIPPPPPESLTEDVELIRLKKEVLEWFKTLPLEAATHQEQLQENAMRNVLAERLHAVEREVLPSSANYSDRITYETIRWLRELRLLPGTNLQQLAENLLSRLRSTEPSRNIHGTNVAQSQTGRSAPTVPVRSYPYDDTRPIRYPEDGDHRLKRPAGRIRRTSLEDQNVSDEEDEEECRCGEMQRRRNYCMPNYMPHFHRNNRGHGHHRMPYPCPHYR